MMAADQVLHELEVLGTEQNRKVYRRHGVGDNLFGVSYADLGKLGKRIKRNHELAQRLWATGNHDARVLALMVANPEQADDTLLEGWLRDVSNYVAADALSAYICKTRLVRTKMEQWTRSADEWQGAVGWNLLACLALRDETLPDGYFAEYLAVIERDIRDGKNRVRHAMNGALIAIGLRSAGLEAAAVAAAQRIGKVVVDHGQTNCKTPDAAAYIRKAAGRRK